MKIFVTGGAGLIGSYLIRRLLDDGHDVLAIDDFSYSYAPLPAPNVANDIAWRFENLLSGARIERCSTLEKDRLRKLISDFCPDCVIHLAAIPLVSVATKHIESAYASLSTGLVNLLDVLRDSHSVSRFVYASSSMVYGNFELDPMPEDGPTNPINIYGGLKLAGENLSRAYLYPTGIEHVIVRPSAVYGPTDQHFRVVQKFCQNAILKRPVLVNASNDHIMDFTYIDDIAQGFFLAATKKAAANETFNMTFGQARRLTELVDIIRQHEPSIATASDDIADDDRPTRGSLSIVKAEKLLDYAPKWSLERGVAGYLKHLRESYFNQRQEIE